MANQQDRYNQHSRSGSRHTSDSRSGSGRSSGRNTSSTGSSRRSGTGDPRRSSGTAPRRSGSHAPGRTGSSRSASRRKYIIRQRVGLLLCAILLCSGIGFTVYQLIRDGSSQPPQITAAVPTETGTEPATQPEASEAATEPEPATEPTPTHRGELPRKGSLPVKELLQNPELPSGCEITSLTCLLNYLGFDVTKIEMANKHLKVTPNGGVSYYEYFVGSPYDSNSFGCFAPVIVQAAQSYLSSVGKFSSYAVMDLSGSDPTELYWQVTEGNPVVVWATINMKEPIERVYWNLPDGTPEMWYIYEHCMVLSGYDLDTGKVEICDPLKGKVQYDMSVFEDRYKKLQSQAVIVKPMGGATPVNAEIDG